MVPLMGIVADGVGRGLIDGSTEAGTVFVGTGEELGSNFNLRCIVSLGLHVLALFRNMDDRTLTLLSEPQVKLQHHHLY